MLVNCGPNFRGRKRACVTYCIAYILSCITKHSSDYRVLMLGRVLGGIATSLLCSAFESWLVAEHNKVGALLSGNYIHQIGALLSGNYIHQILKHWYLFWKK